MSVNDSCRFCKLNLRRQENLKLQGTRLIFQDKSIGKYGNLVSQCSKLGLTLHNTTLRSNRACQKCYKLIGRMVRNIDRFNGWRKRENQKICEGEQTTSNDRRHRALTLLTPPPSSSESSMEKPSRSSVTKVFMKDHSSPSLSGETPDQKGHLEGSQQSPEKCKMADSLLLLECEEEELEPWQQQTDHQHQEMTIRTLQQVTQGPAMRPVLIAPAPASVPVPVPLPSPVATTQMVFSGQTLSVNSSNNKSITLPMLTNTVPHRPALRPLRIAPAPAPSSASASVPAPTSAPVASTQMVFSGQTLLGNSSNSSNSKGITVPLLTNTFTGLPAVVSPAAVPAPIPVASTHMVLSGQALSGSSKDTSLPLLSNTLQLSTSMASVPVTTLPPGLVLVVQQVPFASK